MAEYAIRVPAPAPGPGAAAAAPGWVLADKAYFSRAIRAWLRRHGIRCEVVSVHHATD